jgi:hypothetical protein
MYERRVMGGRWEEEEVRGGKRGAGYVDEEEVRGGKRGTAYVDEEEEGYQRVVMVKPREEKNEEEAPRGRKPEKKDASGSESEVSLGG